MRIPQALYGPTAKAISANRCFKVDQTAQIVRSREYKTFFACPLGIERGMLEAKMTEAQKRSVSGHLPILCLSMEAFHVFDVQMSNSGFGRAVVTQRDSYHVCLMLVV